MVRSQSSSRSSQSPPRSSGFSQWLLLLTLMTMVWMGYKSNKTSLISPQAALVLGGAVERETFAVEFARQHPDLEIWVSSGTNPEYAEWLFGKANIDSRRVRLDYRAVDTVTNFTSLVDDLKAEGITSVYVITSDYHMRRASIIGQIVLGSRGIQFEPITVPSNRQPETLVKGIRDGARAILWVLTGHTGAGFTQKFAQSEGKV